MDLPPPASLKLDTPYVIVAQELPNAKPTPSPDIYRAMGNSGDGPGGGEPTSPIQETDSTQP